MDILKTQMEIANFVLQVAKNAKEQIQDVQDVMLIVENIYF